LSNPDIVDGRREGEILTDAVEKVGFERGMAPVWSFAGYFLPGRSALLCRVRTGVALD